MILLGAKLVVIHLFCAVWFWHGRKERLKLVVNWQRCWTVNPSDFGITERQMETCGQLAKVLDCKSIWLWHGRKERQKFMARWLRFWTVHPVARVQLLDETGWRTIYQFFRVNSCADSSEPVSLSCTHRTRSLLHMLKIPRLPFVKRRVLMASGLGTHW